MTYESPTRYSQGRDDGYGEYRQLTMPSDDSDSDNESSVLQQDDAVDEEGISPNH